MRLIVLGFSLLASTPALACGMRIPPEMEGVQLSVLMDSVDEADETSTELAADTNDEVALTKRELRKARRATRRAERRARLADAR